MGCQRFVPVLQAAGKSDTAAQLEKAERIAAAVDQSPEDAEGLAAAVLEVRHA